jgi:hypothetical protein
VGGPTITEELQDWSFERTTLRVSHIEGVHEDESALGRLMSVYGRVLGVTVRLRNPAAQETMEQHQHNHGMSTSWALVSRRLLSPKTT